MQHNKKVFSNYKSIIIMKKSSYLRKHKILLSFLIIVCFFVPKSLLAQVQNNGPLYVDDYGEVYIASGEYSFGVAGTTATSRSELNYGVLSFGPAATWIGASNVHFADGYIRSYGGIDFIFPVGQSGKLAPFKIIPLSVTSGTVDGAYFSSNPSLVGNSVDSSIATIGTTEYWRVKGCDTSSGPVCTAYIANITLTWQTTSGISTLTSSDISNLTIAGWNGASWQRLDSAVDATSILGESSSLTSGSITTTAAIDLSQFEYFTFGNIGNSCAPLVASSGITKTWNGTSWSPSAPTLADPVIIDGAYSGNLSCNSIVLNANLTVTDGQLVEIVNDASGSGKIILSAEANLVQRNDAAAAPSIELIKITNPIRRYDYVFLSSPINSGSTFYSDLTSNQKVAVDGNYGSQTNSAFSNFKSLDAAGVQIYVTTATLGQGLRALVRNQAPFSTSNITNSWFTEQNDIYIKTSGVANNGDIQVTVPANASAFIGNPYPSAISAEKLLEAAGPNVVQTVYYWTYTTPMSAAFTYNRNDFATWTSAGGVAACSGCQVPNGKIASMQSIYIKGGASASTFNLTNCMRQTTGNDNFFRVTPTDRFWLNLTGSTGAFSQILVAYTNDGTLEEDAGYDGMRYGTGTTSTLSSLINTSKYAIQVRPSFDVNDAVPLAVNKLQNDDLTISLGNKEGVFNSSGTTIYLHDKTLGIYHDLSLSDYSFIQSVNEDLTRFEVVYQNQTLGNNQFLNSQVMAMVTNNSLEVRANATMVFIEIFDLTGRKIWESEIDNALTFTAPFYYAQNIYIAKIKLENGTTASTKLINQK